MDSGLFEAMNGRAPRSNSSCAANWHALTRSWAAPSPCARPPRRVGRWGPSSIRWWLGWADRSRLEPFRKLSRTLKEHFHGILAYLETRLTNAAIEAVNGLLQMTKRIARGFRNFHYFRIAAYLKASRLNLQVPHPLPT